MQHPHPTLIPAPLPRRHKRRSPLLTLLHHTAWGGDAPRLTAFHSDEIRWAVATGLGPLLFEAVRHDPQARHSVHWPLLQSVALTERVFAADRAEALSALVDACAPRLRTPLTLLKGISISEQHYPAAYLRPMRDLDVLVVPQDIPVVEAVLTGLGYEPDGAQPPTYYRRHHHIKPFYHRRLDLWVEVHHSLFPLRRRTGQDPLFARAHVAAQLRQGTLHGRAVSRLSEELQLVYTAVHWTEHCEPDGGVLALLDIIYLVKNSARTLAWEQILSWLERSAAAPAVYLVLSYLASRQLIALSSLVLERLALLQHTLGRAGLAALHRLIDRYFVDGRPFGRLWTARNLEIVWRTLLSAKPYWRNTLQTPWNLLFGRTQIFYDPL